jgi:uncharacterized protein YbjT (DUF2867 family)
MYVVTGATGNTGSVVAQALLAKGEKVRVVGRSRGRLAPLLDRGAEAFEGDLGDSAALTGAFDGARAVYFMVPPDPKRADYRAAQNRVVDAGVQALATARVRYAVTLSSFGADKESGTGPVVGLHYMESRFNQISGLNVLHLRAGYFMENTLPQVDIIRNFGMTAGPVRADLLLPMIASRDIGMAAADALLRLDFSGQQTRELSGQRDLNYTEATRIIGAAIGKPNLEYLQLPADQFIQALTAMGMSKNFAELILEMAGALNDGRMKPLEPRSPANTTPTSFETFVQERIVPAYRGKAAKA